MADKHVSQKKIWVDIKNAVRVRTRWDCSKTTHYSLLRCCTYSEGLGNVKSVAEKYPPGSRRVVPYTNSAAVQLTSSFEWWADPEESQGNVFGPVVWIEMGFQGCHNCYSWATCLRFAVGVTSVGVAKTVPVVKRTDNAPSPHGHCENLPTPILDSTPMVELHERETETPINPLPTFSLSSYPTFDWGEVNGEIFSCALNGIYSEIVHRTRNVFKTPIKKGRNCICAWTLSIVQSLYWSLSSRKCGNESCNGYASPTSPKKLISSPKLRIM